MNNDGPDSAAPSAYLRAMTDLPMHIVLPQAKALGISVLSSAAARATLTLPYREDLIGDPDTGVIAGGAVTTLLDQTCGQAVFAALAELTSIATLDLRIDYMRPARPGLALVAEAHCYKLGRAVAFVRATAHDGAVDDPVATAQAVFMLDSNAGRPPGANLAPRATGGGR
jgi:uncharacterized protein (TIGR00369 family)